MKKLSSLILCAFFAFASCSSDSEQGPPGLDGKDGIDSPLPTIFEVNSNFNYIADADLWSTGRIEFEDFTDVEVFDTDIVLVYRLDAVSQLNDGSDIDEWSLLPQNFFTEDGTIQYVFNHNFINTEIFIDGNYDISELADEFTTNQIFRIAIIPADFFETSGVNPANMNAVMKAINIKEIDIKLLE